MRPPPADGASRCSRSACRCGSHKYVTWINAGRKPESYGRDLYNNLRTLDRAGCQRILVQDVSGGERWEAVRDRLLKAASSIAESDDGATGTMAVLP